MSKKKTDSSLEYSDTQYGGLSLDELVTYCVHQVIQEGKEATFERIVEKAYLLFPKKFSLVGYPQWPDSARVNKSWLRCRTDFKYITGSVKAGFSLTTKGMFVVNKVASKLRQKGIHGKSQEVQASTRSREEQAVNQVIASTAFKLYAEQGHEFNLTEFEFCDLIFCTLESPPALRRKNLELLKSYADTLGNKDALAFLTECEHKFKAYLLNTISGTAKSSFKGGMHKKKV